MTATKSPKAKTPKVASAKVLARKRAVADRKAITAQIRSAERIARLFDISREKLAGEVAKLNGDVKTQLEAVLKQLGVAATVVEAEVETQAQALARTFLAQK